MITNGGYGGVQLALANGVPLVVAGLTEDKMEVSARVTWSGTGVALKTDTPSSRRVQQAAATVLGNVAYRTGAQQLRSAFARYQGAARAAESILEVAQVAVPVG